MYFVSYYLFTRRKNITSRFFEKQNVDGIRNDDFLSFRRDCDIQWSGNGVMKFSLPCLVLRRKRIIIYIIIIMTLFKCQMYLARTALIGDTFQIELEFRNVGF